MSRPKKDVDHVNITLPVGMSAKAKSLGINMSYHAAKAIQAEIELQESRMSKKQ